MGVCTDGGLIGTLVRVSIKDKCSQCSVGEVIRIFLGKLVAEDDRQVFIRPTAEIHPDTDGLMRRSLAKKIMAGEESEFINERGIVFPKNLVVIRPIAEK